MANPKVSINEKFAALLRPLSPEEFAELEASCLKHGIREPLITNERGEILDGVHRFKVAQKHNLPFETRVHAGLTEEETILWIRLNQVGRRNLSEEEISYQRGKLHEKEKSKNTEFRSESHSETRSGDTASLVAKQTGVSRATIFRDAARTKLLDSLPSNVKDSYLSGALKASDKELQRLAKLSSSDAQEVAREVRTGQKSMADALGGRKPADPADPEEEKPKTLADHLKPMIHTVDKLRQKTDQLTDQFGQSEHAQAWLKHSDKARISLAKWAKTI